MYRPPADTGYQLPDECRGVEFTLLSSVDLPEPDENPMLTRVWVPSAGSPDGWGLWGLWAAPTVAAGGGRGDFSRPRASIKGVPVIGAWMGDW